jgi:hypothetical protein
LATDMGFSKEGPLGRLGMHAVDLVVQARMEVGLSRDPVRRKRSDIGLEVCVEAAEAPTHGWH